MKWLGQYIQDLTARFRDDVYLESISTGTIASGAHLGLDSNNKIVKAVDGGGDLTSIVAGTGLSGTSLTGPIPTLNVDASLTHVTSVGTIGDGVWQGDVIVSTYLDPYTAHLSGTQTFSGGKTFANGITLDGNRSLTPGDGGVIHVDTHDVTDTNTSASGTAAMYTHVNIEAPRLFATNELVTTTAAASLYINAAPATGTNQTITNAYALWVDDGLVKFDGALRVDGTITGDVTGENITLSSATTGTPVISMRNTTDDDVSSELVFEKFRDDDAVAQGQNLGAIWFRGQDGGQNTEDYAYIIGEIDVSTDGQESGQLKFGVANHDGGNGNGLILTGGDLDNEIDVTVGLGAASLVTIPGDLTVNGDTVTFESANADDPTVIIKNTTADAQGARLQMKKDRGAAMVQGDRVGEIDFIGEDADQNVQQYAKIMVRADVVTGGQESGQMVMQVANHDGGLEAGLILEGGSEDGEIDATVGLGANSVVTTPGSVATTGVSVASAATTGNAIFVDCNSLTTGSAINLDIDDATTGSNEKNLLQIDYDKAGVIADGEDSTITGLDISMIDAATNHSGSALGMVGSKIVVDSASTQGSNNNIGLIVQVTDATVNTGISLKVEDGGSDIRMASSADGSDVCVIATTTNGATSITTIDGGSDNAHLSLAVDGDFSIASTGIDIAANGTITNAVWNGTKITDIYTNSSGKRFGSTIKILPSDFMINDDAASPLSFKDGGNSGVHVNDAASEMIAFVTIPQGMKATLIDIYSTHNKAVKVYEVDLDNSFDFTATADETGAANTQITVDPNISATATNYLAITVAVNATSQRVWGGLVTIAEI